MQGPALPALAVALALISNPVAAAAGATMRSVRAGICTQPFTQCVKIDTVPRPRPAKGHALIAVNGSSVNPSDVDTLEAGGCIFGCGSRSATRYCSVVLMILRIHLTAALGSRSKLLRLHSPASFL